MHSISFSTLLYLHHQSIPQISVQFRRSLSFDFVFSIQGDERCVLDTMRLVDLLLVLLYEGRKALPKSGPAIGKFASICYSIVLLLLSCPPHPEVGVACILHIYSHFLTSFFPAFLYSQLFVCPPYSICHLIEQSTLSIFLPFQTLVFHPYMTRVSPLLQVRRSD